MPRRMFAAFGQQAPHASDACFTSLVSQLQPLGAVPWPGRLCLMRAQTCAAAGALGGLPREVEGVVLAITCISLSSTCLNVIHLAARRF
jgi:hypothetical protein